MALGPRVVMVDGFPAVGKNIINNNYELLFIIIIINIKKHKHNAVHESALINNNHFVIICFDR